MKHNRDWLWLSIGGVIGGLLGGALLGLVGRFIGASNPTGWGDLVGAVTGLLLGSQVGVLIGLLLAGYGLGYKQRVWIAIPIIIVCAVAVMLFADPLRLNANLGFLLLALVGVPSVVTALSLDFVKRRHLIVEEE